MFKLGMARTVLVHGDATPELWQEDKAPKQDAMS